MSVETSMWFVVPCRLCATEMHVGMTRGFQEKGTGRRTAYYGPRPWEDGSTIGLCGISEGDGGSFECLPCHALVWGKATGATP